MDGIKVFLVEDELVIRRGIKNSIEWEKAGYVFVGEAGDGELAYPMILKEKPDILITDIRMPFLDGLELCKLVKKELPDIKILILSGYDEFDYAKEAIRLGVTEYLLKPVSSAKLMEVLERVSKSIRQEKEDRNLLQKYMEEMRENTEHEKQRFFTQLISGNLSMADALETGRKYGMDLGASIYNLILFRLAANGKKEENGAILGRAEQAIEEEMKNCTYAYGFQHGVEGWAFLLKADEKEQMQERVKNFSEELGQWMESIPDITYFGGVGTEVSRLRELRESYCNAEKALAARFTLKLNQFIFADKIQEIRDAHDLDTIKFTGFGEIEKSRSTLEQFLNNGTEDEVAEFSEAFISKFAEENLKSMLMRQYIIMDSYIVVMSFCERMEANAGQLKEEADQLKEQMKKIQSSDEITAYIYRILKKAIEIRDAASGRRYADIITMAKQQIMKTYMSENISLNSIAAEVGMSPSYFSSIFSREEGKTFVEYLTEIRMDKAKELLMCSSMKTSEIGYEVGYKDPHYFSYIFKKTQHCTPKEFRTRGKE